MAMAKQTMVEVDLLAPAPMAMAKQTMVKALPRLRRTIHGTRFL